MNIAATQASLSLQADEDNISPHRVIALLLDGALERIDQASHCLETNNQQDLDTLVVKTVGILNGLRASLDFEQGGEIATNLDSLYDYVAVNLVEQKDDKALGEAKMLLSQIKQGWDGIAPVN